MAWTAVLSCKLIDLDYKTLSFVVTGLLSSALLWLSWPLGISVGIGLGLLDAGYRKRVAVRLVIIIAIIGYQHNVQEGITTVLSPFFVQKSLDLHEGPWMCGRITDNQTLNVDDLVPGYGGQGYLPSPTKPLPTVNGGHKKDYTWEEVPPKGAFATFLHYIRQRRVGLATILGITIAVYILE